MILQVHRAKDGDYMKKAILSYKSKVTGIIGLLLAVICPVIAILFGSLQDTRVFGGTRLEFFIHSATVDGDIWPWFLLVLLIAEIVCIAKNFFVRERK